METYWKATVHLNLQTLETLCTDSVDKLSIPEKSQLESIISASWPIAFFKSVIVSIIRWFFLYSPSWFPGGKPQAHEVKGDFFIDK